MTTRFRRTRIAAAIAGLAAALGAGHALGAAFALQENSGSALGNAFAGGAASAEDASTLWANPAGMSRLGTNQVASAVHLITPSSKFRDDGSIKALNQPLGNLGGDAGGLNVVPNLYLAIPINKQWSFGLGVNAPFGLVTEYDDGWIGRYQALKSDVKTINVNPAFSWRITDMVAIGGGVNYQRIKATFTNNVNYSAALISAAAAAGQSAAIPSLLATTPNLDAKANIDGDDTAWGWNLGVLFDIDRNTRIGASYRSSIKYTVAGNVNFNYPVIPTQPAALAPLVGALSAAINAGPLANGGVTAAIELPEIANLSLFRQIDDRWDVMADLQFTGWSKLKELKFVRTTGAVLGTATPENFKDVWRFAVGANYRYSDQWMFRGGLAYDQTPVNDTDRTPRLPDGNRTWVSGGLQYKMSPQLKLDAGATYSFISSPSINQNAGSTNGSALLKGKYDSNVIIVSGQVTYSF